MNKLLFSAIALFLMGTNGLNAQPWQQQGANNIYTNSSNVGIGTNTPQYPMDATGPTNTIVGRFGSVKLYNTTNTYVNTAGGGLKPVLAMSAPWIDGNPWLITNINHNVMVTQDYHQHYTVSGNLSGNTETTMLDMDLTDGKMQTPPIWVGGFSGPTVLQLSNSATDNGHSILQSISHWPNMGWLSLNPDGGSVGIGTHAPLAMLHVNGRVLIGAPTATNAYNPAAYQLDVKGSVRADKLTVNTTGADFVLEPSYKLMPLAEVELFVKKNHHLPGIAPAAEMQKNGIEVGEQQSRLLGKLEEITLYSIAQDKRLVAQQQAITELGILLRSQQELLLRLQKDLATGP